MGTAVEKVYDKVTGEEYTVVRFIDGGCDDDQYEVEDGCFGTKTVRVDSVTTEAPTTPPKPVFEIGDHVQLVKEYDNRAGAYDDVPEIGSVGVVRVFDRRATTDNIGVEFIGFQDGHDLGGVLSEDSVRGWFVPATSLEKI